MIALRFALVDAKRGILVGIISAGFSSPAIRVPKSSLRRAILTTSQFWQNTKFAPDCRHGTLSEIVGDKSPLRK